MPTDVRRWTQENRTAHAVPLKLRCLLHGTDATVRSTLHCPKVLLDRPDFWLARPFCERVLCDHADRRMPRRSAFLRSGRRDGIRSRGIPEESSLSTSMRVNSNGRCQRTSIQRFASQPSHATNCHHRSIDHQLSMPRLSSADA